MLPLLSLVYISENPFSMNGSVSNMETIQSKEQWVLHHLEKTYSAPNVLERVQKILSGESRISLRLIDWLVTNYAKKNNVSYLTKKTNKHIIVYLSYKAHLKAYSKKMFDPFCRSKHVQFMGLDTTVGQLKFFAWVIEDEVLDYLEENFDAVHADMEECSTVVRPKEGRKRQELSRSATKSVCLHAVTVKVSFE
jgi:hypothetical protein